MLQPVFNPFPELETERILLRRIDLNDNSDLFLLRSDEKVLEFIGKEPAKDLKEVYSFIRMIDEGIHSCSAIMWGIAIKNEPGKLIGTICLWNIQKENYRAEIGYMLRPEYWRKGIMKEVIQKVADYGFKTMKLHSIEARIHSNNTASAAILESTGFLKEGYLKEEFFFRDKFYDTIIYSRLQ
jgi:[ribosomal protein S5]-alanine N-acetyltransferase